MTRSNSRRDRQHIPESPTAKITEVACIGLGFVGYNSALAFCESGYHVIGVNTDDELVAEIQKGQSPFETDELIEYIEEDIARVTTRISRNETAEAYVISVPTPISEDNTPNLWYIRSAHRDVASVLDEGNLVIIQNTVYSGCITDVLIPEIERFGSEAGSDIGISHVPERYSLRNEQSKSPARVISSIDEACLEVTVKLCEEVAQTMIPVSSIRIAETINIENTIEYIESQQEPESTENQ